MRDVVLDYIKVKHFTLGRINKTPVLLHSIVSPDDAKADGVVFRMKEGGELLIGFWCKEKLLSKYQCQIKEGGSISFLKSSPLLRLEVRGEGREGVVALAVNINALPPKDKERCALL